MKIIKNNVCYVQLKDLEHMEVMPLYVYQKIRWDRTYTEDLKMALIIDEEAIEYIDNQDFIWDASELEKLSDAELENKLKYLQDELENIISEKEMLSKSDKIILEKSKQYNKKLNDILYKIKMLKYYIKYKYLVDQEISYLDFKLDNIATLMESENKNLLIPVSINHDTKIVDLKDRKVRTRK